MVGALWDNEGCEAVLGAHFPLSPAPARQGWKGVAIWSGWRVVVLAREIARWRLFVVGLWRLSTCLRGRGSRSFAAGASKYCDGSPRSGGDVRQSLWSPVSGKKIVQTSNLANSGCESVVRFLQSDLF